MVSVSLRFLNFVLVSAIEQDYAELLKHYCYVGGMPEAAQAFSDNRDLNEVPRKSGCYGTASPILRETPLDHQRAGPLPV